MVKTENTLKVENEELAKSSALIPLNMENKEFEMLMSLYENAKNDIVQKLTIIQEYLKEVYEYDVVNHITSRIKTKESIVGKMKKKNYDMTYNELIEKVNDIAGIRVICTFKSDIYKVIKIIHKIPNIRILNEKDYIKNPKKSGYMSYHIILEDFIQYDDTYIPIKVEIQLRTMAMDFWATTEHKIKYKKKYELSSRDSKKMKIYSKILNIIDDNIMKIYEKQLEGKIGK